MKIGRILARTTAVLALSVSLVGFGPGPAAAESSVGAEFLYGTGSFLATLVWGPAKITYGVLGSVVGGLAWALTGGRNDTARAIMQPALRGDYIVTPDNLSGRRPLSFVGRDPRNEPYPYE